MNSRQLYFPLPGVEPAVLMMPQVMSPETLQQLANALSNTLDALRHEVRNDATDPGQIEYASWLRSGAATPH